MFKNNNLIFYILLMIIILLDKCFIKTKESWQDVDQTSINFKEQSDEDKTDAFGKLVDSLRVVEAAAKGSEEAAKEAANEANEALSLIKTLMKTLEKKCFRPSATISATTQAAPASTWSNDGKSIADLKSGNPWTRYESALQYETFNFVELDTTDYEFLKSADGLQGVVDDKYLALGAYKVIRDHNAGVIQLSVTEYWLPKNWTSFMIYRFAPPQGEENGERVLKRVAGDAVIDPVTHKFTTNVTSPPITYGPSKLLTSIGD